MHKRSEHKHGAGGKGGRGLEDSDCRRLYGSRNVGLQN